MMNANASTAPSIPAPAETSQRCVSVDALRGFDMFWIIGADSLVYALNRMTHSPPTKFLADQLDHAEWEGFHFYDLIFPLFVFIMGVSTVFSLSKALARGGRAAAMGRLLRRGALLFLVALIYSGGVTNAWPDMRLMGVLNRIALCYTAGGLLFCLFRPRALVAIAVALLLGYWALLACVPFPDVRPEPGGTQVITKEAGFTKVSQLNFQSTNVVHGGYVQGVNLANYLDQKYLPGRKYDGTYDPEGLLSTVPAIVTCVLGIFAGLLLRSADFCDKWKVIYLLSFGLAGVLLGNLWGLEFPIIKKLWTSSFVLVAGGWSALLLGVFYLIVDVWKCQWWCRPFVWMGMNSLTVYLANNFIGGFRKLAPRFVGGDVKIFLDAQFGHGAGELAVSVTGLILAFAFVHFLYRRKVFFRL